MGSYTSRSATISETAVHSVSRGRKRKCINEDDSDSESDHTYRILHMAKRVKLGTTSQYIYKTLFLEGQEHDITVVMLGRAWKLHKIYICQSPYFASMFSGFWKETNEKEITVEITDPNITMDSLRVILGSFYQDEVNLESKDIVSILATATLFQLQGLREQCLYIMMDTTSVETVVSYYNAAVCYGIPKVKAIAKKWLEVNLLEYGRHHPSFLKEISPELMTELISSPDLVVMQTEFCIYMMLRIWLFAYVPNQKETVQIDDYFKNHQWTEPFLTTEEGIAFASPFKALRTKHLLLHDQDVKILYSDNLIPRDWLYNVYEEQWLHLLEVVSNGDKGPTQITEDEFYRECFRCGRCIEKPGTHIWRWTAFHFGLDIVVYLDTTSLHLKRNQDRLEPNHTRTIHRKHNIVLKVSLFSLNEQRQIQYLQSSEILRLSLYENERKQVMSLDKQLTYPLYVSVKIQVVTPFASTET